MGAAAHRSIELGRPVELAELMDPELAERAYPNDENTPNNENTTLEGASA
jgi:hypothetical protein